MGWQAYIHFQLQVLVLLKDKLTEHRCTYKAQSDRGIPNVRKQAPCPHEHGLPPRRITHPEWVVGQRTDSMEERGEKHLCGTPSLDLEVRRDALL